MRRKYLNLFKNEYADKKTVFDKKILILSFCFVVRMPKMQHKWGYIMNSSNNPDRVHSQFPTIEEVQNNPALAYSDHASILLQVPLKKEYGFSRDLNIISLNTLIPNNPSGLHAVKMETSKHKNDINE